MRFEKETYELFLIIYNVEIDVPKFFSRESIL